MNRNRCAYLLCLLLAPGTQAPVARAENDAGALERWVEQAQIAIARRAEDFSPESTTAIRAAADAIDKWAAVLAWQGRTAAGNDPLASVGRLLAAQERIDEVIDDTLALRGDFAALPADEHRRELLRAYLQSVAVLIDLSGRLRYVLVDAVDQTAYRVASNPAERRRLIGMLIEHKSSVGAEIMSAALFDPPIDAANGALPADTQTKLDLLRLAAASGELSLIGDLADFIEDPATPPHLVIAAAEAVRAIGLPQDPRPDQDPALPQPPITATALLTALARLPASALPKELAVRRQALGEWLNERKKRGLTEDSYRLGRYEVQPGDFLLMRNPSPYNLFTDLSPGLFTHVGVVAAEEGADGIRRMVIVDLPERGTKMPATNVEVFVQRTLHYVFLRSADMSAARRMGAVAAEVIGNETEFDLNFRTDRVAELRGQPLAGRKIRTYCAGLLLLCTQETGLARQQFFPIAEDVAGGRTAENLALLGLSIGRDFISPTGAIFSSQLSIVGRREPMYDPRREIEEAIYDHFAAGLTDKALMPSTSLYQALRLKLAEAAKNNPALARSIAEAANVSPDTDLVAAAKAAAVVETLDEVAIVNSSDYLNARAALTAGDLSSADVSTEAAQAQLRQANQFRQRHADLFQSWTAGRLSSRDLRIALVRYYTARGRRQLDERFFRQ